MKTIKLSIITINYNNKNGLQKTIDSILCQTWHNFEWIVIDGGSKDGSKELIKQYQDHFSYWCSEPDEGIYNALNKGIDHAKGEYISCMNSGDEYYSDDTLEKVFSNNSTADIIYGDSLQIYSDHTKFAHVTDCVDICTFFDTNLCHQAMFVHTTLLKKKGFDESYKIASDFRRWIDALLEGNSFEYINLIICKFDMYGISTENENNRNKEFERALKETVPPPLRKIVERNKEYEKEYVWDPLIRYYLKPLEKKGKLAIYATGLLLKILNKIF